MFKNWWTQDGKNDNIKDLKKRLTDILNAAGHKVEESDVRCWLY